MTMTPATTSTSSFSSVASSSPTSTPRPTFITNNGTTSCSRSTITVGRRFSTPLQLLFLLLPLLLLLGTCEASGRWTSQIGKDISKDADEELDLYYYRNSLLDLPSDEPPFSEDVYSFGSRRRKGEAAEDEATEGPITVPSFDSSLPTNVSAMMGETAHLRCIVHDLANYTVSWIREADLHILTTATYTFTADQRFECVHNPQTNEWLLKVKYTQPRDSGRYECQVNTKPTIAFPVILNVAVPSARILGNPERYLDAGSTINLTCIITYSPEPPAYVFWYHNKKVINYDNSDSRVSIITDRGEVTRTYLLIHNAQAQASGEYSCAPSTASPDVVTVHILNGEATAAMQTNASSSSNSINNIRSSAHTTSLIQTLVTTVMVMMMLRIVVVTHRWWWWYGDTRGSTMRREGT